MGSAQDTSTLEPTASPPSAGGLVALMLHEDPMVLLEYEVLTPENRPGLLSEAAIAAGGVWNVTMTYAGEGYIALGMSPMQTMANSETIIGMYPRVPEKVTIGGYDGGSIERMPDSKQTLLDASITQENGMTIMRFSKLLVEEGELPLNVGALNNFIWAIGTGNGLSYHAVRSSFTASLEPGEAIVLGSVDVPYKSFWKAHGTVAALGWALFAPLAITSSLCRALIPGPGVWLKVHIYLNMMCMIFTVLLFFLGVAATEKAGADHFNGKHQKIGLAVVVMSFFQVVGGFMRPHPPGHHHVEEKKEEEDTDVEKDGEVDVDALEEDTDVEKDSEVDVDAFLTQPEKVEELKEEKKEQPQEDPPKKSTARAAFEIYHRIIACVLLVLAWWNIDSGLQLFAMRYGNDEDYRTVFWILLAILFGGGSATTIYAKFFLSSQ